MEEKILKHIKLIYKVMKDLNCQYKNQDEFDDYFYAGLFGLMSSLETYDETKGKSNYLYSAIEKRIRNVYYYNSRPKRFTGKRPISLNTMIDNTEIIDLIVDDYNLEKEVINKEYVNHLLSQLKDTKYKKCLMEYYGIGTKPLNTFELAKKYNTSHQYITLCIQRGIAMLRKVVENEEINTKNKNKMGNKPNKKEHAIKTRA